MKKEVDQAAINQIMQLEVGSLLTNEQIVETFKCSSQGGMRRSLKTKSLVLISDHSASLYDDRIDEQGVLHYTGMGKNGDQALTRQNKTLNDSRESGIKVFFFDRYIKKSAYRFLGQVRLIGDSYIEDQYDDNGDLRKVYVFPLELINTYSPLPVTELELEKAFDSKIKKARKLSNKELFNRVAKHKSSLTKYDRKTTVAKYYPRSPFVIEYAHRRAKGYCELCSNAAPFKKDGQPFLEVHHVKWLSKGGEDTIDNVVALCPNCHRKMHALNRKADVKKLEKKAKIKLKNN